MKSFPLSYKHKKPGVSLLIAVICSTVALVIVLTILTTVSRSVEQSQDLERSTQVFFAIESGLEAGFFHHNARGQGVSFLEIDEGGFDPEQIIAHSATTLDTYWTLDGRFENTVVNGLIYEDTPLQLRWYWDDSDVVSEKPTPVYKTPSFTFKIKDPEPLINFGLEEPGVVLSWMITKKTNTGTSSLVPKAADPKNPCGTNSLFMCRDNATSIAKNIESNDSSFLNTVLPSLTPTTKTLDDFLDVQDADNAEIQFIINPLRPFANIIVGSEDQTNIEGIPFTLAEENHKLPRQDYTIHTRIVTDNFSKELILENIPEQTAIQAFSYAIFD